VPICVAPSLRGNRALIGSPTERFGDEDLIAAPEGEPGRCLSSRGLHLRGAGEAVVIDLVRHDLIRRFLGDDQEIAARTEFDLRRVNGYATE
jgi:hypothetical protein